MCIIAIKCKGVEMPSEQTLKTMWTNNPHGAGLMYTRDGRVYIDKGYMDWTSFHERIKSLGDTTNTAIIMHFRIATHGGVCPGNTHPFPVSDNIGLLTKLRLACKLGVAHNGIIPIKPRDGISDTMEYIATRLAPLNKEDMDWYMDSRVLKQIGQEIKSKLAVLDGDGIISYYGDFIEETDGMIYSNTSYKPRVSAVYTYRDASPINWEDGDLDLPPWDTGRKSVWLMPAYDSVEVIRKGIVRTYPTYEELEDIEDLWVDRRGNVYGVDYESAIAYKLPEFKVPRLGNNKCFDKKDGIRFEDGGSMYSYPF